MSDSTDSTIKPYPPPPSPTCPRCGSKKTRKKGKRKTIHDLRQRFGCSSCGHLFINQVTKYSPYPVKLIMEGITLYNLGHSARQTISYLRHRFGIRPPEKTFRFWYDSHKPICTYHQIREKIKQSYPPAELVKKLYLKHRQVYLFQLHKGKLDHLLSYSHHRSYQPIKDYLLRVQGEDFPHDLFTQSDRSSKYPILLPARVTRKENYATKLAALPQED